MRAAGDLATAARLLGSFGDVGLRQGRYQQAIGYYEQAVALHRETGHRLGEAEARNGLAELFLTTGQAAQPATSTPWHSA